MSKKPRNPSAAAQAIVAQNVANLPDNMKSFVTPSQVAKATQHVQEQIDRVQGQVDTHLTKTYSARGNVIAAPQSRGAYQEPKRVTDCLRIYATPDNHVKARSRRGWTAPKAA